MVLIDSGPYEITGYKELARFIAALKGCDDFSERQAKRLVRAGLPVTRDEGKGRGYIRANPVEVAAWWERRMNKGH